MPRRLPRVMPRLLLCAPLLSVSFAQPPATRKEPVVDVYHGVHVTDDYRWLENGHSPETRQWVSGQNAYSRAYFERLPFRDAMKKEIFEEIRRRQIRYSRIQPARGFFFMLKNDFFMLKNDPSKQQPMLVVTPSLEDLSHERTLVDPNVLNKAGSLSIDWFKPSLDGRRVAVAMSEGGSEDSSLYIFDVAGAKQIGEVVPRVNYPTGGGSMAWLPDNNSFFYTRYPQGNERPSADKNFYQQIWLHHIGAPTSSDAYILGKEFPRIAETVIDSDASGKNFLASVANGDGGEFEHFLRTSDGTWHQITRFEDAVVSAALGEDGSLYLISRKDAPRGKILHLPAGSFHLADAKLIVPEGKASIEIPDQGSGEVLPLVTPSKLYLRTIEGGPNQIAIYDHSGKPLGSVPLAGPRSIGNMFALRGDSIAFETEGYLDPPAFDIFNGSQIKPTAIRVKPQADFSGVEVERAFAKSKDGTMIPMTIVHKKGLVRDGSTPALVTGYGGFGISMTPTYLEGSRFLFWLEHGNTLVITNLRGGGEYGAAWHTAGNLLNKQNVFDDFSACARYIADQKISSPAHMAALGGSNGGLLMGAEITQHPGEFRAVVSMVGIYDMLRTELDPNGAFNITEYGSVKNPEQFKALYAYSPYQHVDRGAAYPAILMMTGDNDGRVNPAHSRKMIAALQAATSSKNPILLRTAANAGHGIGTPLNERVEEMADIYAFLFEQLGIPYHAKSA